VAIWSSTSGNAGAGEAATVSEEPWLADGVIGDLVFTPRSAKDGPLALRVVMGVGRDPKTCSDQDPMGCIVAKRSLAFVPNTRLRVPMVLHLACEGVVCAGDTTCNFVGQCVSAVVDPGACARPEGCFVEGDDNVVGVNADAGALTDVTSDLGVEFVQDASIDTAAEDAGTDAPSDAQTDAGAPDGGPLALPEVNLVAGGSRTCYLNTLGQVRCWGFNFGGILGVGDTTPRGRVPGEMQILLPVDLGAGRKAVKLSAGAGVACVKLDNNQVKCWGENQQGTLGMGDTVNRGDLPGSMGDALPPLSLGGGFASVTALRAAGNYACALGAAGAVKCWGFGLNAELGLGDTLSRGDQPGEMGALLPPLDLGAGLVTDVAVSYFGCALTSLGQVKCWGRNDNGQLGRGDALARGFAPGEMGPGLAVVDLGPGLIATQITTGQTFACARLNTQQVKCWGNNNTGQLGLGDTLGRGNAPLHMGVNLPPVDLGAPVQSVAAGASHVCAVLADGRVKCWGDNLNGKLGLGDTTPRGTLPGQMGPALPAVDLGAGRTALQVSAGAEHTCARLDNGALKCWGRGFWGELGQGDNQNRGDAPGEMGDALLPIPLPGVP